LKRGEIWTVAGAKDYAGKRRPAVILQDERFDATESITICVVTADPAEAPLFRVPIAPNERNGLNAPSRLMVDKITTVPKNKLDIQFDRDPKVKATCTNPSLGAISRAAAVDGRSWPHLFDEPIR
jgi:mRNA interferase MazF